MVRDDGAAAERRQSSGHITRRAEFLAEAGRRLGASLHPDRSARAVVEAAVPILADDAVLFWPVRGPRAGWHRAGSERASGQLAVAEMERTPALAKALRGLRAQPERCGVRELSAPADVMGLWPDGDGQALVVALPGTGMPCGVLVLARGPGRPGFDDDDVGLAQEFAVRAGAALAAAALYTEQVAAASALQDELVPDTLPDVVGVRLGAVYRPAREELRVSGDFYQVRPGRADGGADFVFGDVCGSGVEAAVIGRRVRHSLRSLAVVENRPVAVLRLLNEALVQDGVASFATVILGSVRPARDGGRDLVMAGGGHLPPLVLRGDGRIEEVEVGGMLVGAVPEADFDEAAVHLAAGESILLYSDGITKARGGPTGHEMYGEPRLRHGLATCAGMPAGAVVERLDLLLGHWLAGRPHDDLAMLVIQALERGPSGPSGSADDRPSS